MTQGYLADYQTFAANGGAAAPAWLKQLREAAIARFARVGFPSTREEEWRFTSVAAIAETRFTLQHQAPNVDRAATRLRGLAALHTLVFVDGFYVPELSVMGPLPAGVRVQSLTEALRADPELVRLHLGRQASPERNAFTALATAFLRDGAFVYVPPKTLVPEPLQLLFVSTPGGGPHVTYPRTLVVLDDEAQAAVVETYLSADQGVHFTNAVTEIVLGAGARMNYARVQRESESAYHVATTHSHQDRDSVLASTTVALGAAL